MTLLYKLYEQKECRQNTCDKGSHTNVQVVQRKMQR